jgi:hypothetical protein
MTDHLFEYLLGKLFEKIGSNGKRQTAWWKWDGSSIQGEYSAVMSAMDGLIDEYLNKLPLHYPSLLFQLKITNFLDFLANS